MKSAFRFLILMLLTASAYAQAAVPTRVIIQVDTNAGAVRVDKIQNKSSRHIEGRTLPIVKASWKAGWYRPVRLERRFRTINGNVYLENVIFLAGSRTIRTTRHFNEIAAAKTPVSGAIVLEPDYGSLLYETVSRYGTAHTWIHIRK